MAEVNESKVAPKAEEPTPAPVAPVVAETPQPSTANKDHVASRNFMARFEHQVLSFKEGDVIEARIGEVLRATGAPIKLVEKLVKETKGKL